MAATHESDLDQGEMLRLARMAAERLSKHAFPPHCRYCKAPVEFGNSLFALEGVRSGLIEMVDWPANQHVLPVVEDGVQLCKGSRSRAQYLEGQPRDSREGSTYAEADEDSYRAAFAAIQQVQAESKQ